MLYMNLPTFYFVPVGVTSFFVPAFVLWKPNVHNSYHKYQKTLQETCGESFSQLSRFYLVLCYII